jgi:hypothetical protein
MENMGSAAQGTGSVRFVSSENPCPCNFPADRCLNEVLAVASWDLLALTVTIRFAYSTRQQVFSIFSI